MERLGSAVNTQAQIQAETYQRPATQLVAQVSLYDSRGRWRRAAKTSLPLFAGALITAPIPPLHVFSVPALLGAGIVLGLKRLREARIFETAQGPCPACGAALELELRATAPPRLLPCPKCGEFLKLSELR